MLEGLTSAEVTELLEYYRLEPFGEWRADLRNAIAIANLLGPHLRKGARLEPLKFMPYEREAEPSQAVEDKIVNFFKGFKRVSG